MNKRSVVIVGGGSSGWIAAAYLNGALNDQGRAKNVDITLVESPDVPRISVGEATIPSILHVLEVAGIDEADFVRATDATYKQAIKYRNWVKNDGSYYYHPFTRAPFGPIDRSGYDWALSDRSIPYMETVSAQPALCEMGLSPRMPGQWNFGAPLHYAFHMNAELFADYLRDFSVARGVTHVRANVIDVDMKGEKLIAALKTDTEKTIAADMFIDCTGFASILVGKKLGVEHLDQSQFLMCDRATVMPIPYDVAYPGEMRSYTTSTALSAGWIWDIPLQSRRAIGYVHSSEFINEEDAERELRAYEGPHGDQCDARIVNFRVGWRRKHWEGNCIALGLAGGFIEPLESTGLYLSELGSVMLAEHFPYNDDHMEKLAFRYNRIMQNRYYEILDFINLHYCLTKRDDSPFWREVRRPERITDRVKAKLDFWKCKYPSSADLEDQFFPAQAQTFSAPATGLEDSRPPVDTAKLWSHYSYECIMYGMDYVPFDGEGQVPNLTGRPASQVQPRVRQRVQAAPQRLPTHKEYLRQISGFREPTVGPKPAGWG